MADERSVTKTIKAGASVWLDVPLPPPGEAAVIDGEGRPLSGRLLGLTSAETKVTVTAQATAVLSDEAGGQLFSALGEELFSIEGQWLQVYDLSLLHTLLALSDYYETDEEEHLSIGGKGQFPADELVSVAVIYPLKDPAGKFGFTHLYSALQTSPFELNVSRLLPASSPFKFDAQLLTSRPVGDQLGAIVKQK
jgi:hypothetical protein